MPGQDLSLDFTTLRQCYRDGSLTPRQLVDLVQDRIGGVDPHRIWIARLTREQMLAYAQTLEGRRIEDLPLYGIPFAIKDNIDLAGVPTTAGCPEYAYTPTRSAGVVQRLIDAGAIPVGKTNLDQFATGLVGTRSPYGACRNSFNPDYVAGGSSSGSAVAVALGQVSFALGTDTAGSGRVPAAFNNLIGLKPTRGLLSTSGVVPACRTLDCVSIFALTARDTQVAYEAAIGFDEADEFARRARGPDRLIPPRQFRFGVPEESQLEFFGNDSGRDLFRAAVTRLTQLGGEPVEIDLAPFLETARLLYEGPWLAERYVAIREFIDSRPGALHPVTRAIIEKGRDPSAADTFAAIYRLAELRRAVEPTLAAVDLVVTPTAGTIYRIADVEADPVRLNANLGYYTNFMNLLDLCAVALPAGMQDDGLPFGISLFAPAFNDAALLSLAGRWQARLGLPLGATRLPLPVTAESATLPIGCVTVAVCGAHLSGLPLNHQLTERGAVLLEATRTAPCYRFYALPGGPPMRPGLARVAQGGGAIEVELWALPLEAYGSFVAGIPAPLGIGMVKLADGRQVQGFVCETYALDAATDVTAYGGWRAYLAAQQSR